MYQQPDPYPFAAPLAPAPLAPRRRRTGLAVGATALAAAAAIVAVGVSGGHAQVVNGQGRTVQTGPAMDRQGGRNQVPNGSNSTPGRSSPAAGTASAAQQIGVVDINTVLQYRGARAAGTGMVLTSSGEILTNNHVVEGATSISVQVVTTGRTYKATVVGTAPTKDVAVLQLQNASGLQVANLGSSTGLQVGAAVTGVGNAGGAGGTPSAAAGTIIALDQALTASDENGQNAERLTGMIETDAQIQAGDSGGPLFDSANEVIGMDTAASSRAVGTPVGFAIPIGTATAVADQIEAGHASATIHIGYPGFLGVSIADSSTGSGALVQSVVATGPAAKAGIGAGDVITSIGGTATGSSTALRAAVGAHRPGQSVAVTWLDSSGQTHHASVTLIAGPAD
ncbi:MAG: S1C family serine protease [Actinomycetota bacterium]|nr:S1C family serine protease [Actinomycetota bacterium]